MPVCVIVADQGHGEQVAETMRKYEKHPHVDHLDTSATCLWENWKAAAEACETEFFAWLQDDDELARGFARRVVEAFDVFPKSLHYQARVYPGPDSKLLQWWGGNGPWVMMDILNGVPAQWPGEILIPSSYLTSWTLSPGVAFRCGDEFNRALKYMPLDSDLLSERTILASMGAQGPWIADPVVAGAWIHHGENESYKQHVDQARQTKVMIEHLDELMDHIEWHDIFHQWLLTMSPAHVLAWVNSWDCDESRYSDDLKRIMEQSLRERCEMASELNGKSPQVVRPVRDPVVLFD